MTQTPITDDEAFIRAIVAAPGDDAPRLVYADWLDERGDPRGVFLRAELTQPRDPRRLAPLAATLDPVWVARVTRPPAGICCTHLSLSSTGPSDYTEITAQETALGVTLPPQLRALFLNYSLGHLRGGPFVIHREVTKHDLAIDGFVCLINPDLTDGHVSYDLFDRTDWLRDEFGLDTQFLYLASTFYDIDFVVSCRHSDHGSVHEAEQGEMYDRVEQPRRGVERVADSIGEFLALLQPRTWPLTDI